MIIIVSTEIILEIKIGQVTFDVLELTENFYLIEKDKEMVKQQRSLMNQNK